jgi:hypothetical protein
MYMNTPIVIHQRNIMGSFLIQYYFFQYRLFRLSDIPKNKCTYYTVWFCILDIQISKKIIWNKIGSTKHYGFRNMPGKKVCACFVLAKPNGLILLLSRNQLTQCKFCEMNTI